MPTTAENDRSMAPGRDDSKRFESHGYCIQRRVLAERHLRTLDELAQVWIEQRSPPFELECDVGYQRERRPAAGEPEPVRRFLQVFQRDPRVAQVLVASGVIDRVRAILGEAPRLVLAHHNCLMTKVGRFSSATPWHRDLRYWAFERGELVTAWIPLSSETPARGGLRVVPGSHRRQLSAAAFERDQSLRVDVGEGARAVGDARSIELERGDLLLFHCRVLHAAGVNTDRAAKLAYVFTFRRALDRPLAGSRSARGGDAVF